MARLYLLLPFAVLMALGGCTCRASSVPNELDWVDDYEVGRSRARDQGRPLFVEFVADWCLPCKEMDRTTYRDPEVIEALGRFVTVRVDATHLEGPVEPLLKRYSVLTLPTLVFHAPDGERLPALRSVGFVPSAQLLAKLRRVP